MPSSERDRDAAGRPRSSRPRDALGRPLPRGAKGGIPEEPPPRTPEEALDRGIQHFNAGHYFHAHEAWEHGWHPAARRDRNFWQGLTQIAVGLTHRARGNPHGSVTLLRRGAFRLRAYGQSHMGVPVAALVSFALRAADRIERDGVHARIYVPHITRKTA